MSRKVIFAAFTILALLSACSSSGVSEITSDEEALEVKIGMFPFSSYLPLFMAEAEGYYAEEGLNVTFINFTTVSDAMVALIQGQIDVTAGTLDIGSFRAISEGIDIQFVADKGYLNAEGCTNSAWMARNELIVSGQLDNIANLVNYNLVYRKSNAGVDFAMDTLLSPYSLTSDDLSIIQIPIPNILEAFSNGAVDVAGVVEPWITRIENSGNAQIWQAWQDYMPGDQLALIWFGPTLVEENREAGKRFMVAYLRAVQQYNEGKTDRNVELMAEFTQIAPEEARQSCWQSFNSDGSINFDTVQNFQEWAVEKDFLDEIVPVEDYWDDEFIDYANQALE